MRGLLLVFSLVAGLWWLAAPGPVSAQRGGKQSARDLFYAEAGLIVSPDTSHKGKFAAVKRSVVAVALGVKCRIWKVVGGAATEADPAGTFTQGDSIRLGVEINDTGYLYIVRRQSSGRWRRVFPTPEIEHGNHFVR
ncbi:MAG: hypothetical protein HY238_11450, partial [Acidobacteria bacterium]|nr:hypothetical protein [Acidobacteriota bacterium]